MAAISPIFEWIPLLGNVVLLSSDVWKPLLSWKKQPIDAPASVLGLTLGASVNSVRLVRTTQGLTVGRLAASRRLRCRVPVRPMNQLAVKTREMERLHYASGSHRRWMNKKVTAHSSRYRPWSQGGPTAMNSGPEAPVHTSMKLFKEGLQYQSASRLNCCSRRNVCRFQVLFMWPMWRTWSSGSFHITEWTGLKTVIWSFIFFFFFFFFFFF